MPLQPQVGHDRGDDAGLRQPAVVAPALGDHRHQLVAVDHMPLLVDDHDAVRIAVEGDADVGAHLAHLADERVRRGRANALVDVEAIRLHADRDHFRAQLPERFRRHLVAPPLAQSMTTRMPSRLMLRGSVRLANSM